LRLPLMGTDIADSRPIKIADYVGLKVRLFCFFRCLLHNFVDSLWILYKHAACAKIETMRQFLPYVALGLFILTIYNPAVAQPDPYETRRLQMVERDIEARGVKDSLVLTAMRKVQRHLFVEQSLWPKAYNDHPLPIDDGQTISQPYVVALMTEALALRGDERVLEVGTGSGYQAAILAQIVKEVFTIEIRPKLYTKARERLQKLGYKNIHLKQGDGYLGWPEYGPFDAVIVTASPNHIPPPLLAQLKEGGRLIIPLGSTTFYQNLTLVKKRQGKVETKELGSVAFVPLVGEGQKK
jgi:protein-L-isoaspartate(D-aspartate) O-methyltransferase